MGQWLKKKTCYDPDTGKKNVDTQYIVPENAHCCEISCKGQGRGGEPDSFMDFFTDFTEYMKVRCNSTQQNYRCTYKGALW